MGIIRTLCACAPLLVACGGGDMTGLTGIYTIDSWTENTAGCDVEGGPAPFQDQTALYVKVENFFGEFINVVPCADLAECETMAGEADTIHLGNWGFIEGSDEGGWTDDSVFAFDSFDVDGQCEATGTTTVMTAPAEGSLRIEARTRRSDPYPPPAGAACSDEAAEDEATAAVEGRPCEELEVVSATFDRGLP